MESGFVLTNVNKGWADERDCRASLNELKDLYRCVSPPPAPPPVWVHIRLLRSLQSLSAGVLAPPCGQTRVLQRVYHRPPLEDSRETPFSPLFF